MVRAEPSDYSWDARSLSHSSKLVPGGNTGELKAVRKGTGHPTSLCRRLRVSVLSNRHSPMYGIVYGINLYLFMPLYWFKLAMCI